MHAEKLHKTATVALLGGALACYLVGAPNPLPGALVLGGFFEAGSWFTLARVRTRATRGPRARPWQRIRQALSRRWPRRRAEAAGSIAR